MTQHSSTRPSLTSDRAAEVAREYFPVRFTEVAPLPSDRDQNFLLTDGPAGRRHVLKVARSGEEHATLDFQNRILEHLTRSGFPLSRVLFAKDGQEIVPVEMPGGNVFYTRILTWLPGDLFHQAKPQLPALLGSLGSFLGGMDRALEDFTHPAQDRVLDWNLQEAGRVISDHLSHVDGPRRRALVEELSAGLLELLHPLVGSLRTTVIHGDANDHNVLISPLGPGDGPEDRRVVGVVDFGDAVRSFTVAEPAIAAAYVMMGKRDPLAAAAHVLSAYHRAYPLTESEIEAFFPLVGLRLCVSVVMAAFQKRREPDNHYLTVSESPAWSLLESMRGESPAFAHYRLRDACGLDPVPQARAVVKWLKESGGLAAPVVGSAPDGSRASERSDAEPLDLRRCPVHVFDLSIETGEFGTAPDPDDAKGWTDVLFAHMRAAGAEVGIGRYDEVRQWYTSDIFQVPGENAPEWRTVHLGIDIFLDAGAPVFAPFDAVVHSVAENAGSLDYGPTVILEHRVGAGSQPSQRFWTLYGHLDADVLGRLTTGTQVPRGRAFARIGTFPRNGNWAPHLHFQILVDTLGVSGNFPGVAPPSQRRLWRQLSPDPNLILQIPSPTSDVPRRARTVTKRRGSAEPGRPSGVSLRPAAGRSTEEILDARRRHLGPNLSVAYGRPLKIVRGSRQFLVDHEGQSYLDCVNNVPHVGHSHPAVVDAAARQMALLNTNTRYLHDLLVEYAERLVACLPEPLSVVYFVCSGSEANELALRMARAHTRRRDVLVVDGAYHGNTSSLVDMSPYKYGGPGGEGAPAWVESTLMPDLYRGRFRARSESNPPASDVEYLPSDELGARYAADVGDAVARMEARDRPVAAFFCEPMLGCGGQIVPPAGYLSAAFQRVREGGGVCVADEVQVGFGRVGSHFWAFEAQGALPDIVTLGKPMGNGHPLGAVVTTPEIASSFNTGMEYFNTFGGNAVSCAVGLAVLDVIAAEGLQENARVVGDQLLEGFRELQNRHPLVGDVRGLGLYLGIELVSDPVARTPAVSQAWRVKERLRERRILLSTDGPDENVLKIKPPLVFTREDATRLVAELDGVLEEDGLR